MTTIADIKRAVQGYSDQCEVIVRDKNGNRLYDVQLKVVEKETFGCLFG